MKEKVGERGVQVLSGKRSKKKKVRGDAAPPPGD